MNPSQLNGQTNYTMFISLFVIRSIWACNKYTCMCKRSPDTCLAGRLMKTSEEVKRTNFYLSDVSHGD